jgi:O-antigen/teichoic acid export membrane protein
LIWLLAPFAVEYFRDPRVLDVIRVMALAILIGGFENIGIVAFQKNMEFGRDFQFFFFRRIAGFAVTIALALWLHSYWAMVIGAVVGRTVGVVISYWLHDYRPRFSVARLKQIWSFSQWILVRNLGSYGAGQIDKFLVGRRTDATAMGSYALADEIAAMPSTELLAPLSRVLFPLFVNAANDPEKLRAAFCKAIGVQSILGLPAGVGLFMVADDAVLLLLGERWQHAIPLLQTLALASIFSALGYSSSYLLVTMGRVSVQALLAWIQLGMMAFLAIMVFPEAGAQGLAYIRLATAAVGFMLIVALMLKYIEIVRLRDLISQAWRPVFSTIIMALALSIIPRFGFPALIFQVAFTVAFGAAVYACAIFIFWRMSGCSDGAETYLLEQFRMKDKFLKWMRVSK